MIDPATGFADTTRGTDAPFRNTLTAVMALALLKLVPWTVTPWLFAPLVSGAIWVITGTGGSTLKTTAPVVPPGVVTVILRLPCVAFAAMTNVAVICVELTRTWFVTVMPVKPAGLALIVAPFRLVPVRVTLTLVPAAAGLTGVMAMLVSV